jgi:hypothetical protein
MLPAAKCSSDAQAEAPETTARKALEHLEAWYATLDGPLQQQELLESE